MAKQNILIGGPSGSGKTTLYKELKKRGFTTVDSDSIAYNGDPVTGAKTTSNVSHETWIWDEQKISQLLNDKKTDVLFICGDARNRDKWLDKFDKVFELQASEEVIIKRLKNRPGRVWGKSLEEQQIVIELIRSGVDKLPGAHLLDAKQSLDKIIEEILSLIDY